MVALNLVLSCNMENGLHRAKTITGKKIFFFIKSNVAVFQEGS